jgi:hypothetical protein
MQQPGRIESATSRSEHSEPESFAFLYLPDSVAAVFKDTLSCYSSSLSTAFPVMCRRTALTLFADVGPQSKLQCFNAAEEVRELASIDPDDFAIVRHIIFDLRLDSPAEPPVIDGEIAAILVETMKDILYQMYVRKGRLQQALQLRRFFVQESKSVSTESGDVTKPESIHRTETESEEPSIIERVMRRSTGV